MRTHLFNMIRLLVCLLFFVLVDSSIVISQEYAREVVNTLASDEFKGRGYVDDGDKLAANYIKSEFQKFGLQPFQDSYFQPFNISVNTFPNILDVSIDGTELQAGIDFLIDPSSPSINGTFDIVHISPQQLLSDLELRKILSSVNNKFLAVNIENKEFSKQENERAKNILQALKYDPNLDHVGVIEWTDKKLTWHGSTFVNNRPIFKIVANSVSELPNKITVEVVNKFYQEYPTQNVIGFIEGEQSDSLIVLMAHYDHLGKMGNSATFNGANDNASGTSMLLSLAKHYSQNKPTYNTVFIAFAAEEMGLLGAKHFVQNSPFNLNKTKFFLNFDLAGTGDEGIQVVNGSVYKSHFETLQNLNNQESLLPAIKVRGAACNSDHCMFDEYNIPGFYIYTLGGIKAYHDIYDRAETLPLTAFSNYKKLIIKFINQL